jgi:probable F420-dependent oxidoreductase
MSPVPEIGIGIPNYGGAPHLIGIGAMARAIEQAGFDTAWLTDHIVLPTHTRSKYPFTADGHFSVPAGGVWFEPVATLAYLAGVTRTIGLGIGVLVLPLRDPRQLALQIAAADALSGGRVQLGVGTGWLKEEFDALEVPFVRRGDRLDGAIDLVRACWTGHPESGRYGPFTLPAGVTTLPTPLQPRIPLLVAGNGPRSLDRVAARGDGWFGALDVSGEPGPVEVARIRQALDQRFTRAGRDPRDMTMALRVALSARALKAGDLATRLTEFASAGVDRFIIDFGWRSLEKGMEVLERISDQLAGLRSTVTPPRKA